MEPNTLAHHGVKGMKWGVRRFQNRDGSLTSKGKIHRNKLKKSSKPLPKGVKSREEMRAKKKAIKERVKTEAKKRKQKESIERYEKFQERLHLGKKAASEKGTSKDSTKARKDISSLSNEELRSVVDRMRLEKEYKQLTALPPKKQSAVNKFLKVQGQEVAKMAVKKFAGAYLDQVVSGTKKKSKPGKSGSDSDGSKPKEKAKAKEREEREVIEPELVDEEWFRNRNKNRNRQTNSQTNSRALPYNRR